MRRKLIAAAFVTLTTLAAGSAMAQMPAPEDMFKAWDKNADGVVDKAEWVAAGRKEERFAMVDANNDGKITVDELKTAMAKMKDRPRGDAPRTPPADQ